MKSFILIATAFLGLKLSIVNAQAQDVTPMTGYTPTELSSYEEADEIFQTLNDGTRLFSQCFNRAHVWARQMDVEFGVRSMKILIYYTDKFRKDVNPRWWFHIAPMVSIAGDYYVMDRGFTEHPTTVHDWTKIFTDQHGGDRGITCSRIDNISEYYAKRASESDYCFVQYVNMYHWEPNDIEQLENDHQLRTSWNRNELHRAIGEAFWRRRKVRRELL